MTALQTSSSSRLGGAIARLPRRSLLLAGAALAGWGAAAGPAQALPAKTLVFPRDRGAHPAFRTEWWYITGQASTPKRASACSASS